MVADSTLRMEDSHTANETVNSLVVTPIPTIVAIPRSTANVIDALITEMIVRIYINV